MSEPVIGHSAFTAYPDSTPTNEAFLKLSGDGRLYWHGKEIETSEKERAALVETMHRPLEQVIAERTLRLAAEQKLQVAVEALKRMADRSAHDSPLELKAMAEDALKRMGES
jgi:hypothetical protein